MAGKRLRNEALQERPDRINRASVTLYVLASLLGRTNKLATTLAGTHTYVRPRMQNRTTCPHHNATRPVTPPTPTTYAIAEHVQSSSANDTSVKMQFYCYGDRGVGKNKLSAFKTTCAVQVQQEIQMPPEAPTDFAVGLHLSEKHGVVFMITKAGYLTCFVAMRTLKFDPLNSWADTRSHIEAGYLFMFDIATGTMLVRSRVSQDAY